MAKVVTIVLLFISPLLVASLSLNAAGNRKNEVASKRSAVRVGRSLALNDFEAGTFGSWIDESAADARWNVEDFSSPIDPTQPAPQPPSGTKYLRVSRPAGTSGMAVLRSVPFMAESGDQVSISFWIRSQIIQTNNLEIYWSNNGVLERILSLVQYSTPTNFEWRTVTVLIPTTETVETQISIYGFCNSGAVDAVAVDNLVVEQSGQTVTTTTAGTGTDSTTTGTTGTTQSTTTTASPGTCPSNLGSDQVKCVTLSGKCYCFSLYKVASWYIGDTYCRNNGANLLSLETQTEITLIDNYITGASSGLDKYAYWTSGQWGSSSYTWTGSGQPFSVTNWYPGQPDDNTSGFCVRLFYGTDFAGRWSDIICSGEGYAPFYFICEL